jgi:hypothetical protein
MKKNEQTEGVTEGATGEVKNEQNAEELTEIKKEKLKQLVSRTDMSGNDKVEWLVNFIEEYASSKLPSEEMLIEYTDSLREYIRESGNNLAHDERNSKEFVQIWMKEKLKK